MNAELERVQPVLMCRDVDRSIDFYRGLGFALLFQDSPQHPRYAGVRRDRVELHLQWMDETQWSRPADRPAYRFVVSDVDALYAEFQNSGRLLHASGPWAKPGNTPWGTREFHLRDPGENVLQFYAPL